MPRIGWRRDNAGIVAAAGQNIGDIGIGEKMNLVGRFPGRNMIALSPDDKHRPMQIRKSDWLTLDPITAFGEIVVEEQLAQIVSMHSIGHASRVRIP